MGEGAGRTRCGPLVGSDLAIAQHEDNEHKSSRNQESAQPIDTFINFGRDMIRRDTVKAGGHADETKT